MKRFISAFLLILLLFPLLCKGNVEIAVMGVCPYMCGKLALPQSGKSDQKGGCHHCCGCNAMVRVNAPVYLSTQQLNLNPIISLPVRICLPLYRSGESADHVAADWKPPKCAVHHYAA